MDTYFTFRLDKETSRMLQLLAKKTFRSQAGVLRMLIHQSSQNPNLLVHEIENLADRSTTSEGEVIQEGNKS
jgi:predicted transcriptional regulator